MVFGPAGAGPTTSNLIPGTDSCTAPHIQYHVSGRLAVRMDDGTEFVAGPDDLTSLPSGHDAWVVGEDQSSWWTGSGPATTPVRPMPGGAVEDPFELAGAPDLRGWERKGQSEGGKAGRRDHREARASRDSQATAR